MLRSDESFAERWNATPENWTCPTCSRTKEATVYVADKGKITFLPKPNSAGGPWSKVDMICNQCFSILMSLKSEVSQLLGARPDGSYDFVEPNELADIIIGHPHSAHEVKPKHAAALVSLIAKRLTTIQKKQ